MGDKGIKYLVRGLQRRPTKSITRLYMDLKWSNLKELGSIELSKLLQSDCAGALNLNGNDELCDPGTFHIAEKLRTNTSLTELQLYTCGLTSEGAGYVAKALTINDSLEILNLGGNKIEDEGVNLLASALKINRRLKSLELSSCGMTDKGLKLITDSLQHNTSLEELKLYNFQNQKQLNDLTVNGAAMDGLFDTIGKTSTLRTLLLPKEFESSLSDLLESVTGDRKFYNQPGVFNIEGKS
jgi:Ran GTPase-activating protein (RanGAP) involved in mRNA processing and transport